MRFSYFVLMSVFSSFFALEIPAFSKEQRVAITTSDGLQLEGILTSPEAAPKGALLILPGSGNVDADGDVSSPLVGFPQGSKPSAKLSEQIASALERESFVTLRYRKRGYTTNPAEAVAQPMSLLLQDANAAIEILKKHFPNFPIGIVGLSEGALLASMMGSRTDIKALFLLSLPTRSIDETLFQQFVRWPVDIARERLDANHDGVLSQSELTKLNEQDRFPFVGNPLLSGATVKDLDQNGDGAISIVDELVPRYQALYENVILPILQMPSYLSWYRSLKEGPAFNEIASKVRAPIYIYQGMQDAHLDWSWVVSSQHLFSVKSRLRLFAELGHCLAPADGSFGEAKTSGPLHESVLQALTVDLNEAF